VPQFTEYEAHYFPGPETRIARLSEPKNYSAASEPRDSTVLCAELPCAIDDEHWKMGDEELGRLVVDDLAAAGLALSKPPLKVFTRRLGQAYPIYLNGFEAPFATLDRWVDSLSNVLSYGLQGLFAHDHTHHALFMAYCAVDCLRDGHFDRDRWHELRKVFATHVVED
jgi:protoporphyrinogen oxidase